MAALRALRSGGRGKQVIDGIRVNYRGKTKKELIMWCKTRWESVARVSSIALGLLSLCVSVVLAPEAQAHLAGYQTINGVLRHVASFDCEHTIGGVPNPDTKPSKFECEVSTQVVQVLCRNPAGNEVAPGTSAIRLVVSSSTLITPDNITDKKQGKANVSVHFPDEPFLQADFCVNPNWQPTDALVLQTMVKITTSELVCSNKTGICTWVTAYTETLQCALPPGTDIVSNPPVPDQLYNCTLITKQHVK